MILKVAHLLVLTQLFLLSGAWICSTLLKGECDSTQGEERCYELYDDMYVKPVSTQTFLVKNRMGCFSLCSLKRCSCSLLLPDMRCILMFTDKSTSESAAVLKLMGTNVAKGKPATASSIHSSFYPNYVVDGKAVRGRLFYHSGGGDLNSWLQIDLLEAFKIRGVRVITRQDHFTVDRFNKVQIYVGNTAIVDKDFSPYTQVVFIATNAPTYGYWYNSRLNLPVEYRYVIFRLNNPGGYDNIELLEVEVLV